MNTLRTSGLVLCTFIVAQLYAQFPLVNTSPGTIFVVGSLSSGMRYIGSFNPPDGQPGTRTIYNMDLTVHRVLNFPAPPANMRWANMGYITEDLFDTDPSTIEFTMVAMPLDGPGDFASFVIREDASILFSQNPGSFTNGPLFIASYGPIFTTPDGTFMMVHTSGVNGPPVNIYQLPGTLPCMDCYGSPQASGIGTGENALSDPHGGMALFPNPAQQEVRVQFNTGSVPADQVVVTDAAGRMVLSRATYGNSMVILPLDQLVNGHYNVAAVQGGRTVGSLPLLIMN